MDAGVLTAQLEEFRQVLIGINEDVSSSRPLHRVPFPQSLAAPSSEFHTWFFCFFVFLFKTAPHRYPVSFSFTSSCPRDLSTPFCPEILGAHARICLSLVVNVVLLVIIVPSSPSSLAPTPHPSLYKLRHFFYHPPFTQKTTTAAGLLRGGVCARQGAPPARAARVRR